MDEFNEKTAIVLVAGSAEYSAKDAAVGIDELIGALQQAKQDGAEFGLMSSGNYRGAQWQRFSTDWSWAVEE